MVTESIYAYTYTQTQFYSMITESISAYTYTETLNRRIQIDTYIYMSSGV